MHLLDHPAIPPLFFQKSVTKFCLVPSPHSEYVCKLASLQAPQHLLELLMTGPHQHQAPVKPPNGRSPPWPPAMPCDRTACEPRRDLQVYCGTRSAVDGPTAPGSLARWLLLGSIGWLHDRLDGPTAIRLDGPAPALHPHCRLDGSTAAFRTTGSMARLLPSRTAGSMAPAFRTTGSMARRLNIPATGSMAR